ncbi:MAG TPA: hypothetical protein DCW68_01745 [Rhodospirillaceae bacterium]|nr:MAG: hypothetical protein A2018_04710 [Alphaproteobacteria bacterium GWF2_58_20]HAU28819.1 hypothetical protein [Rhodospirillaceae bacterium]
MANLILTVIAVALVATVSVIAVFYGGSAYNKYQEEASAMRVLAAGDQIVSSAALYANQERVVPAGLTDLLSKNYLLEVPVDESGEAWEVRRGYAVLSLPDSQKSIRLCLTMRKKLGLDAEARCADAEMAGCTPKNTQAPEGCNKHCLRTCFDPADRSAWNPLFDRNDPCCMDNSQYLFMTDPVFP